jgi:hypothetical protein
MVRPPTTTAAIERIREFLGIVLLQNKRVEMSALSEHAKTNGGLENLSLDLDAAEYVELIKWQQCRETEAPANAIAVG